MKMIWTETETKPRPLKPTDIILEPADLAAGRYGTYEQVQIWGPVKTIDLQLRVQGQAAQTLSRLHPDIVPPEHAAEINEKANVQYVDPDRVRELEDKTGHDIIAVNTGLEEQLSSDAVRAHVNKAKTSADTTQPARALQIKSALEVMAETVENLRDIVIEKAVSWIDFPTVDQTHMYDAMPSVVGRPFAHYAEMMQSGLSVIKFVYNNSIMGKWGDATGNHHSAKTLGIDGIVLEEEYCNDLGIGHMIASAQIPGLEFEADVFYALVRIAETSGNLAQFIGLGRGDDSNIFVNASPKRKKGSSGMPHKDAKNGNPTTEEQNVSMTNYMRGNMVTALCNCTMPYARTLYASANGRINFEDGFKFMDHALRNLAKTVYWLGLNEQRALERVNRTHGVITSPQVLTYLTDQRRVDNPMARNVAHDLLGRLATEAWETHTQFVDVLLREPEVTSRLDGETIRKIADPANYIGESKRIIQLVKSAYHKQRTFP